MFFALDGLQYTGLHGIKQ